jgi:hypothetical protein
MNGESSVSLPMSEMGSSEFGSWRKRGDHRKPSGNQNIETMTFGVEVIVLG